MRPDLAPRSTAVRPSLRRPAAGLLLLGALAFCLGLRSARQRPAPGEPLPPAPPRAGPAAEAPPPAEGSGALRVETRPAGATVFLNGRLAGATPLSLSGLPAGQYALRLEKEGHLPRQMRVEVTGSRAVEEELALEPAGRLWVEIEPAGAEVWLDGNLAGLTPLRLENLPAGRHELRVLKTNHSTYATPFVLHPGETARFQDFELQDKILATLRNLLRVEPYCLRHYLDLGHYHFLSGRIDEAAETLVLARELSAAAPRFPPELSPAELDLERQWHNDDLRRLPREITKHKDPALWGKERAKAFERALLAATEKRGRANISVWTSVRASITALRLENEFARAETLCREFLRQGPAAEADLAACQLLLLELLLLQHKFAETTATLGRILELDRPNAALMPQAARLVTKQINRFTEDEQRRLLEFLEPVLRRNLTALTAAARAETAGELGNLLRLAGRGEEAIPLLKEGAEGVAEPESKDRLKLQLAQTLAAANRKEEALEMYEKLTKSVYEDVQAAARRSLEKLRRKF